MSPTSLVLILHQNNFFIPKRLLVPSEDGELDTDCTDAIDFAAFLRILKYTKREGRLPPNFHALLVENCGHKRALSSVDEAVVKYLRIALINSGVLEGGRNIGIVDGFPMY